MSTRFVRFTLSDGEPRPIVINAFLIEAYWPWKGKTAVQIGGDSYSIAEMFDEVDRAICAAVSNEGV